MVQPLAMGGQACGKACHHRASPRGRRAEGVDRGARRRGQPGGQRGMVEMSMGDDDPLHPLPGTHRRQDRRQMRGVLRSGIDHRQRGRAHEPGVGPRARQGRGVRGKEATDWRV
jgi:hypothetical protein